MRESSEAANEPDRIGYPSRGKAVGGADVVDVMELETRKHATTCLRILCLLMGWMSAFSAPAFSAAGVGTTSPTAAAADEPMSHAHIGPAHIDPPPKPLFDPKAFGASGDGVTYDTAAVQKAIDACAGTGGSVYLHNGRFLCAHLTLKGGMTLFVEKGAVLLGGTRPEDYPVVLPERSPNKDLCRSLLYAASADHLILDGGGVIDGHGQQVKMSGKEPTRPSILRIFSSDGVTVRNLTLRNPRMWTQIYIDCKNVTIDHETVNAPPHYCPNLDGMDICDCSDVTISNCRVNSDDDSICLKSGDANGLHNVVVENNLIRNTGANGIKIGTASAGPISGIQILNNTVLSAALGGLCIESVDGSAIGNFTVRGLDLYHTSQPIFVRLAHRSHQPGSITGVKIEDVRAVSTNAGKAPSCTITGIPGARIDGVLIKDCYFEMPGGVAAIPKAPAEKEDVYPQSNILGLVPGYAFYVRHADGVVFDHVSLGRYKPDARPWLASEDAKVETKDCVDLKQIKPTKPPAE